MSQDMVVAGSSVTARQMREFWKQVVDDKINGPMLQAFLEHRNPFGEEVIRDLNAAQVVFTRELVEEVYREFGIACDLNPILVDPTPGFWDVYMHPDMTPNKLVAYLKQLDVNVYQYIQDLDGDVRDVAERPATPYRVRFRARLEADEETKNLTANEAAERGYNCITLRERLLLEVLYFKVTKKHLDENTLTRCDGSRYSGGHVPHVHWYADDREVCVNWCPLGDRNPRWRTRLAVS